MEKIIRVKDSIAVEGLVVLSGSKSWISKVIKWWTSSKFSHVSILLGRVIGDSVIKFEAQERGVIPYCFGVSKNKRVEIWRVAAPKSIIRLKLAKILTLCGKRYWFENIPGFVISDVAGWFGVDMTNPFDHDGGYWCAKLGQHYVNEITRVTWLKPGDTTPEDMKRLFDKNPDEFKLVGTSDYGQEGITWLNN